MLQPKLKGVIDIQYLHKPTHGCDCPTYIHLWAVSVVEHHIVRHDPSLLLGVTRQPRRTHANTWQEMQIFFEMTKYFWNLKRRETVSYPSSAAPRCARGRWPPRWSPRAPAPLPPRRGSCTCRGRHCYNVIHYRTASVVWSGALSRTV